MLQVGACGICGTDIHIIDGEFPPTVYPIIIGHEFGGEVTAVGDNVTAISVGDRVGLSDAELWRLLLPTRDGISASDGMRLASPIMPVDSRNVAVPERVVYPIPDTMSMKAAALIEPVSCVVRGFHRLQPQTERPTSSMARSPMGLLNAQVARYNGASLVALIDINPSRLERAKNDFGFEHVATNLEELRSIAPRGFDNVIEATGVTKVAEAAIDAVKRRGKLLLFGVCPPGEKASYDAFKIYNEEISILGTMAVLNSYGPASTSSTPGRSTPSVWCRIPTRSISSRRRSLVRGGQG